MNTTLSADTVMERFDDGWSQPRNLRDPGITERLATLGLAPDASPGTIGTPASLAAVLLSASPSRAFAFALFRHERECERQDEERASFWRAVVDEVRRLSQV